MSKLSSQQFMPLTFVLAIWTLFFIQVPFGATVLPDVISGSFTAFQPVNLGNWSNRLSLRYQRPGYVFEAIQRFMNLEEYQSFSEIRTECTNRLLSLAKLFGEVSTLTPEGHFQPKNAFESMKATDLSFVPYLFKDKEIQLHLEPKMVNAQAILRAERLPKHFENIILMAANQKRPLTMQSASFEEMVFLEIELGKHFQLVYDTFVDMELLQKAASHAKLRNEIFSDAFHSKEAALNVYHFLDKLQRAIELHVTDLIMITLIGSKLKD